MHWLERIRLTKRFGLALPGLVRGTLNANRLLDRNARKYPFRVAIAFEDERYDWRALQQRANRYAHYFLSEGIRAGDRVVVLMDNRPDFLFVFHGLQKIGAVAALINTSLAGEPLAHVVRVAEARKLVIGSEHVNKLGDLLSRLPELRAGEDVLIQREGEECDLCGARVLNAAVEGASQEALPLLPFGGRDHSAYIYTSGTTGLPKAAVITHQRFTQAGHMGAHILHRVSPGELIYVALPLYHSNALFLGWSAALASGAGVALRRKFSATSFFPDVQKFDAVSFVYIGELCRYLLASSAQPGERNHRLRACAGNGMRPDVWEEFQERFGIPIVREIYGATEGTSMTFNLAGRPGMVGRMMPGMFLARCDPESGELSRDSGGRAQKIRVGETGLLLAQVSAYAEFDGYLDRRATRSKIETDVKKAGDRYFNTGDLLKLHKSRWLSFTDRVGDTFRWKGENVSTNEVAMVLTAGRGVSEANVYGVEISGCEGRAGMAAIRVEEDFDLKSLAEHVCQHLAHYQRPLFIRIEEGQLEVTTTFKHQKVKARKERFDPGQVSDLLYYLVDREYLALDHSTFEAIERNEIWPG